MKNALKGLLAFAHRGLTGIVAFFVALVFFLLASNNFIEEKSIVERLFASGVGFLGGMVGGGILGWIVGGVGVVAMGTGIGVGAIGAVVVGATFGSVLGLLTGTSISFFQLISHPEDYDVNWLGLLAVLMGAIAVFFVVRWVLRLVSSWIRRVLIQQKNVGADT